MKKLVSVTFLVMMLLAVSVFAQKIMTDKVPAGVKQAFMKEYPKAMEPSWRMAKADYQVMFAQDGIRHSAKFDKNGKWIDKEERVELSAIPKEVNEAIAKNFAGYKAYEAEKVETPAKGMLYNVGLENESKYLEVHFSMKGEVLDKVAKSKKNEWGKDND